MFIHKRRTIVDLVVDNKIQIFLGVVGGDLLKSEFFVGHFLLFFLCIPLVLSSGVSGCCVEEDR